MFREMTKHETARAVNKKLLNVKGIEDGVEWNLMWYVKDCTIYKGMIKVTMIHKYFMTFEVMEQLHEQFEDCDIEVEADNDRIVLNITWR